MPYCGNSCGNTRKEGPTRMNFQDRVGDSFSNFNKLPDPVKQHLNQSTPVDLPDA